MIKPSDSNTDTGRPRNRRGHRPRRLPVLEPKRLNARPFHDNDTPRMDGRHELRLASGPAPASTTGFQVQAVQMIRIARSENHRTVGENRDRIKPAVVA